MSVACKVNDAGFLRTVYPVVSRPLARFRGPRNVLFAPGWGLGLGDQCLCVPLVRALIERYPDSNISILTQYTDFWAYAALDGIEILSQDFERPDEVIDYLDSYDLSILGHYPGCLVPVAGAGRHVLFAAGDQLQHFRCFYADERRCYEVALTSCATTVNEAHKFLSLFVDLGVVDQGPSWAPGREPQPVPRTQAISHRPRVLLHPFAAKRYKEWPVERWQELAGGLLADNCLVTVSSGTSKRECALAEQLARNAPGLVQLQQVSLAKFMASLGGFNLVISGDTAIPHLVAYGGSTASLGIFGPTDPFRFCPPNRSCFFLGPFSLPGPRVRESVTACLSLLGANTDRLARPGRGSALRRTAATLYGLLSSGAMWGNYRSAVRELTLLGREYHGLIRPEYHMLLLGDTQQSQRIAVVLRRAQPELSTQYLCQSSLFRSAAWLASRG